MASSHQQALTIARQLAGLRLHRVGCETSGMQNLRERAEKAMKSSRGAGEDTSDDREAALAWEMARAAQSCASLAAELQILAQIFSERTLALPDSTYKLLFDSTETLRLLLGDMAQKLFVANIREDYGEICALNAALAVVIRCMLDQDSAITTVEYMISTKRAETSSTADAGGTR